MQRRIKNLLYDTTKSQLISRWCSSSTVEELHRKRTGEYYLYSHNGRAATITPLTPDDVDIWIAHRCGYTIKSRSGSITVLFDPPDLLPIDADPETRTSTTIRLPRGLLTRAKRQAGRAGVPLSRYIEMLIGE